MKSYCFAVKSYSMKFVIFFGLHLFCVVLNVEGEDIFKCVPGVAYQENDCNHCSCEGVHLGCTLKGCYSQHHSKLENCEVGSTWKRDCDQCWCLEHIGTVCTLYCGEKASAR
ncbi:hypothetical protein ILUMI_22453 [Ignelater luminosus]|uniref:Pacifastin domain-containing protein n=1 Tax=Ignelater luminosus TaxID=2038154 RepID=A0A8K0FXE6_IGNLU|nr:hypothetical protein ILUMI_22453 [Ignelater luminosus]